MKKLLLTIIILLFAFCCASCNSKFTCIECGQKYSSEDNYCPNCGAKITKADNETSPLTNLTDFKFNIEGYTNLAIGYNEDNISFLAGANTAITYNKINSEFLEMLSLSNNDKSLMQNELSGYIDKLYVYKSYVVFSFTNEHRSRPQVQNLACDSYGEYVYDKTGYITSPNRENYIFNISDGQIYKINKSFNYINQGMLKGTDGIVYTYEINNNDVVLNPLSYNADINVHDFFEDCYGKKYISNDKLAYKDEGSSIIFFVMNGDGSIGCTDYYCQLKETRETIHFKLNQSHAIFNLDRPESYDFIRIVGEYGIERELDQNDNYTISEGFNVGDRHLYKIESGKVMSFWRWGSEVDDHNPIFSSCALFSVINSEWRYDMYGSYTYYAVYMFEETECLLFYKEHKLYYIKVDFEQDIYSAMKENAVLLIDNCTIMENDKKIETVTPSGTIQWEIYVEYIDNIPVLKAIQEGTYNAEVEEVLTYKIM